MPKEKNVTHLLERLEAFEERCEIRLEALYLAIEDDKHHKMLRAMGELHPRGGVILKKNIRLRVEAYDTSGRLVAKGVGDIRSGDFYGFETFSILVFCPTLEFSKVRVYPKMS